MIAPRHRVRWAWLFLAGPVPAVCSAGETAPPQEEPARAIIVTGERTARAIADVPVSVAVSTAEALARQPDTDRLDRILQQTPNVVLGSGGQGPTIRGQDTTGVLRDLGAFLGGTRPRATLVVDGRAVSYNELVFGAQPLWDVAQVELFRSPQTTTQGNNAVAGAIFIETGAPSAQWQAGFRAIAGNLATRQVSAMVTGPLADEELTVRLAGDIRRGLTSSDLAGPAPAIDPNRDDYHLLRLKVAARPRSLPDFELDASFVLTGAQAPQIEGIREPFAQRRDDNVRYGIFRSTVTALTLRPRLRLGGSSTLSAVLTAGSADVRRFAPPGFGEAENAIDDRSIEINLHHQTARSSFVVGASLLTTRLVQDIDLTALGFGIGAFKDTQQGRGLFGEAQSEIVPRLTLTAGARLQWDQQVRRGTLATPARPIAMDYVGRFSSFSPKLSLSYRIDRQTNVGVLVQRAANPGGATLLPSSGRLDSFAAESLWNYELFLRGRIESVGLGFSANLFHYDMHDAQRSVLRAVETPGGTFFEQEIGNVAGAWSRGGEIALDWSPRRNLFLTAGIGLLDTKVTRTPTRNDPLLGKQFQRSPHFTGILGLNWRPAEGFAIDVALLRRAGYFSDDINTPALRVGPAGSLNARAEWTTGPLRLFAFTRNAFDDFSLSFLFDRGRLATAEDPREFGVGTQVRF